MPKLIKNITATYYETLCDDVSLVKTLTTELGQGDYQKVGDFIAYLQDYTNTDSTEELPTPVNFGLGVNKNKTFIEIEISY